MPQCGEEAMAEVEVKEAEAEAVEELAAIGPRGQRC